MKSVAYIQDDAVNRKVREQLECRLSKNSFDGLFYFAHRNKNLKIYKRANMGGF